MRRWIPAMKMKRKLWGTALRKTWLPDRSKYCFGSAQRREMQWFRLRLRSVEMMGGSAREAGLMLMVEV